MVGFTVAFKDVFLEGLEVVIIVLTLGGTGHDLPLAALSAATATVLVGGVGAVVARQKDQGWRRVAQVRPASPVPMRPSVVGLPPMSSQSAMPRDGVVNVG
jgi:hypothetical protein